MASTRWRSTPLVPITALAVAVAIAPPSARAAQPFDLRETLRRPGVRVVAVDFFATWCGPCKAAVPRWARLHRRYRADGMRLVVVNTLDPEGRCVFDPRWSPDEKYCDDDGRLAKAWGVGNALPSVFVWSWQGELLLRGGDVEEAGRVIRGFLGRTPRVAVVGKGRAGRSVTGSLREKLLDTGKLIVTANAGARKLLDAIRRGSHGLRYDQRAACRLGRELPANAMLRVVVTGRGGRLRLGLTLYSVEKACPMVATSVPYDARRSRVAVAAAVDKLLGKLRGPPQLPIARAPPPVVVRPRGFARIPAGRFLMGSPASEAGRDDDEKRHPVVITRPFWLQRREVTQGQWKALMGNNPSYLKACGDDCPVEGVNWWEALAYCNALSRKDGLSSCYRFEGCNGKRPGDGMECRSVRFAGLSCPGYRLPTEAEWEYAARAGTATAVYTGALTLLGENNAPELDAIAWYGGNSGVSYKGGYECSGWKEKARPSSRCGPHPVGGKGPNRWGLHDMLGNVWEWTWDWYGKYSSGAARNPTGPASGSVRVLRGGGWGLSARDCRAAGRGSYGPGSRVFDLGFRPARSVP